MIFLILDGEKPLKMLTNKATTVIVNRFIRHPVRLKRTGKKSIRTF